MSGSRELSRVADELGREKGISREILTEALYDAVGAAVAKRIGKYLEPDILVDLDKGEITISIPKEVSESMFSNWDEITVEEAKELVENPQLGDVIMVPTTLEKLGRQAALVARQRLMERLRDAEKQIIMDEFQGKIGEIINGNVLKLDRGNLIISIGNRTEAIMPRREMIQGEFYERGAHVRALLLDIKINRGWPQLILSRTHPDFLMKLFETEIPEVYEGIIQVKAVAREPGERAKVAVYSASSSIDPVGACIGVKGSRINSISRELNNERIDVIEWSADPIKFVCNAISPANVLLTHVLEDEKTFELVVPNDQLSLAIGKRGQNVKLAAMLTEWRLDVLSDGEYQDIRKERLEEQEDELRMLYEIYNLDNLEQLDADMIGKLRGKGIDDVEVLSSSTVLEVIDALGINEDEAVAIISAAIDYLTTSLDALEAELEDEDYLDGDDEFIDGDDEFIDDDDEFIEDEESDDLIDEETSDEEVAEEADSSVSDDEDGEDLDKEDK